MTCDRNAHAVKRRRIPGHREMEGVSVSRGRGACGGKEGNKCEARQKNERVTTVCSRLSCC